MKMIGSGLLIIVISVGGKKLKRWEFGFIHYKFIAASISVYFMQKFMSGKHTIKCFSQRLSCSLPIVVTEMCSLMIG